MSEQRAHYPCECGVNAPVVQLSPYEFAVECLCGRALTISWAHKDPPPTFAGTLAITYPRLPFE